LISKKFKFCAVQEIEDSHKPRLGIALQKYVDKDAKNHLIVDDVLTTGRTIEEARYSTWAENPKNGDVFGVVIFARGKCPDWVYPIFQMWDLEEEI